MKHNDNSQIVVEIKRRIKIFCERFEITDLGKYLADCGEGKLLLPPQVELKPMPSAQLMPATRQNNQDPETWAEGSPESLIPGEGSASKLS